MPGPPLRLFLDSNVLTGGILASWGLDKAILSLCASRICRMVLAEVVMDEVEANLILHASALSPGESDQVLKDYDRLIKLARPIRIPAPSIEEVRASRRLITHAADVPVLISAMKARPDWMLTHNTRHFSEAVAGRAGIRIATPSAFFKAIGRSIEGVEANR